MSFDCIKLVVSNDLVELVKYKALHSVLNHAMACEEEKAEMLNVRRGFVHLANSDEKLVRLTGSNTVCSQVFVQDKLIWCREAKLNFTDEITSIDSSLVVIFDKREIDHCLNHFSLRCSLVYLVVQGLHDKGCILNLWNDELAFVLLLISQNLHEVLYSSF